MRALFFPAAVLALTGIARCEDFKTNSGSEFKDVTVSRVEPDGLVLMTDAGVTKVKFSELSDETRKRYGYDAAKEAAYLAASRAASRAVTMTRSANAAQESRFAKWTEAIEQMKGKSYERESPHAKKIETMEAVLRMLRAMVAELDRKGVSAAVSQQLIDSTFEKKIFVGMPSPFVLYAWGQPTEVNKTLSTNGTSEQWVYRRGAVAADYVTVENEIVTFIQN